MVGWWEDGNKAVAVDNNTGYFVTLGETRTNTDAIAFPVISGSLVSVTTKTNINSSLIDVILFDKNGERKAVNNYGVLGWTTSPLNVVLNGNLITVVGNNNTVPSGPLPVYNSLGPLTSGTYTNNNGQGFVIQFEYVPAAQSINNIRWATRLNGYGNDIAKTPDGKYLYVTSVTDNYNFSPVQTKTLSGAYNNSGFVMLGKPHYQVWKFDSVGVRQWSTIFKAVNNTYYHTSNFTFLNNASVLTLKYDDIVKCKIACDSHGFALAGETDTTGLFTYSKYGAPIQNTFSGRTDAFFARFNKKDSIVYSSYVGGNRDESYTAITPYGNKEFVMTGYTNSDNKQKIATMPGGSYYSDTTITNANAKILVTKFDTIGNKTWSTYYGTNNSNKDIFGWGVAADNKGNVYVSGRDLGSLNFTSGNPYSLYYDSSRDNTECYMLGFSNTNVPNWETWFGGWYEDIGMALAYNPQKDAVILTGLCNTTYSNPSAPTPDFPITSDPSFPSAWFQWKLNNSPGPPQTAYDIFISFFSTTSIVGIEEYYKDKSNTHNFELFPNPAQNQISLAFKNELKGKVMIEIYNEIGQLVQMDIKNDLVNYSLVNLNTQSLNNGLYIVKVTNGQSTESRKLIIAR